MGIRERKQRHVEELREQILAASEELFVRDGYDQVSMRKIAAKIEYSPTTIYRLFRNKAEIMQHLMADGYRRVHDHYREVLASKGSSPLQTLRQILHAYVLFALDNPSHYRLWYATGELELVDGRLRMHHGELSFTAYQTWLDLIADAQEQELLSRNDPLLVFQIFWSAVHGVVSLRLQHPGFPWMPIEQHLDALLDSLTENLAVSEER